MIPRLLAIVAVIFILLAVAVGLSEPDKVPSWVIFTYMIVLPIILVVLIFLYALTA